MKTVQGSMRIADVRGGWSLAAVLAVLTFACAPAEDGAEGGVRWGNGMNRNLGAVAWASRLRRVRRIAAAIATIARGE